MTKNISIRQVIKNNKPMQRAEFLNLCRKYNRRRDRVTGSCWFSDLDTEAQSQWEKVSAPAIMRRIDALFPAGTWGWEPVSTGTRQSGRNYISWGLKNPHKHGWEATIDIYENGDIAEIAF